tara:strand:- start:3887 stop:4498 length:612 start_codon:yes stop_codon:yes gene_type:complete
MKKKSKNWIKKQNQDQFFKQAKILGYRSRSAFKLMELNKKFNFLKKNSRLLDLGSSPGGWSQVASKEISRGKIISIDLKDMEEIKNVKFYKGDFLNIDLQNKVISSFSGKIDVLISDMAVNTTGNKDLDCIRTNSLCLDVILFSLKLLKENGTMISKLFMGQEFNEIKDLAKSKFEKINFFKPESSKDFSKETYIHCKGLKSL